tara:strand:- start:467 stop:1426 length:960 start_codon:yes stop_codon:yes gene_type:complete
MKISPYLQETIDGLVISDASLRLRHANGNATFSITSKHKSVCEKIANTFLMHGITGIVTQHNPGKDMKEAGHKGWKFESHVAEGIFTDLYHKWYPNNIKHIPNDLNLTPTVLAFCIIGDGHNKPDSRSQRIILCLESFPKDELDDLVVKLKELGIESAHVTRIRDGQTNGVIDHNKVHYRIEISVASDVNKVLDMITPIVIPSFEEEFGYKLQRPQLIRTQFTRLKTADIIEIEKTNPELAKQLVNDKKNTNRKKKYSSNEKYAQTARDRSKKNYQNMSPAQKKRKADRRRELAENKKLFNSCIKQFYSLINWDSLWNA